jgi:hypothetical protein
MAVIRFTDSDVLATVVVNTGIYPAQAVKYEGPKASQSGKSNNYFMNFQITDGKYKNKEFTICFNTGINDLMPESNLYPHVYLLNLQSAIEKQAKHAGDLDLDQLLHKPFDISVVATIIEGVPKNMINGFHPAGYGAQGPAF